MVSVSTECIALIFMTHLEDGLSEDVPLSSLDIQLEYMKSCLRVTQDCHDVIDGTVQILIRVVLGQVLDHLEKQ